MLLGTNLYHDFTAVIFPMKLGVVRKKTHSCMKFHDFLRIPTDLIFIYKDFLASCSRKRHFSLFAWPKSGKARRKDMSIKRTEQQHTVLEL